MTDNPYTPPPPIATATNPARNGITNSVRWVLEVGSAIIGGLAPLYLPIFYFGDPIRRYCGELPVLFRLLLFGFEMGLMYGGMCLGHWFSTKVWRRKSCQLTDNQMERV